MITQKQPQEQYFAISLDDLVNELHDWLGRHQDGPAGHYARFNATDKAQAVEKCMQNIRPVIERMMYESTNYGYPKEEGDSEEE